MANEDYLTQCLLTIKSTLEADEYFTPTDGRPPIPVAVEVFQDIQQIIQMTQMRGLLVTAAMESAPSKGSGGCLTIEPQFVVRVVENISINRSPSGHLDNGLRVAQKIEVILNGKPAAKREDGTNFGGGSYLPTGIVPAVAIGPDGNPSNQCRAYHATFRIPSATITDFTRLDGSPPAGAP